MSVVVERSENPLTALVSVASTPGDGVVVALVRGGRRYRYRLRWLSAWWVNARKGQVGWLVMGERLTRSGRVLRTHVVLDAGDLEAVETP